MAFLTSLSSPSPPTHPRRRSSSPGTRAGTQESVTVGSVHVRLRDRVPQATRESGILGPRPVSSEATAPPGEGPRDTGCGGRASTISPPAPAASPIPDLSSLLGHFWGKARVSPPRVPPSFGWWEGKVGGDSRSFAEVRTSPLRNPPMAGREMGGRGFRGDGGGEGRFGRGGGGGRIGPGGGRDRGGGRGGRNMVWMREAEDGRQISSNVDPRHGGSDKAKWEAAAMEVQGGTRGEKWGDNSTQVAAGGSAGGRLQETRPQQQPADRRHPTPGKRNASPLVGGAEVCVTCKDPGHLPVCCPRAVCGRCGIHGHLALICNTVLPWECVAPMCGFQAEGKGFFYIHDHSTPSQTTDRNRFIVISVVEGRASGRQLEEFFNSYINTNWRCSARSIGPNTFVMRFPSPRDVDKACFAESMNVKSCGAVINLRKWSESMGAKGVLNVAWVNLSNIPLDKRHEKNIAYVGSLVGVTLEIDKATINRPESVRIKLGCRDAEDIPASAEGVLGGHFYDFFYSVDKILIKNPPRERIGVQQENEEGNAAKKARFTAETPGERNIASSSTTRESSAPLGTTGGCYGKNVIVPSSVSIPSKKFLSYLDARMGEPVVTEMDPTNISDDQKKQAYLVQSPENSGEKVEVIPTPPVREEMQTRCSKRNMGGNVEHMGLRAERLAQKRDLQGNSISHGNSFEVLSNLEIISAAAKMGVNIPDDDFDSIDIIRELEISRANIAKKVDKNDVQHDTVLLITNVAGEASLLDTEWGGDEDLDNDDFTMFRVISGFRPAIHVPDDRREWRVS
ncbi:hypothetical protein D1007_24906 [Hordeum vulgare]|nr:hypothetical protein D1007_24906 [Hordeum vulgare]